MEGPPLMNGKIEDREKKRLEKGEKNRNLIKTLQRSQKEGRT
jgi:hypothetical protein